MEDRLHVEDGRPVEGFESPINPRENDDLLSDVEISNRFADFRFDRGPRGGITLVASFGRIGEFCQL